MSSFGLKARCLGRSLIAFWIILASMIGEAAVPFKNLSPFLTVVVGSPGMFFILPALVVALLGILGAPLDWAALIVQSIKSLWPEDGDDKEKPPIFLFPVYFVRDLYRCGKQFAITLYRYLVPQIIAVPDDIFQKLPPWVLDFLWIFFKEPCKFYYADEDIGEQPNTKVNDEIWLFVNGVATTKAIAKNNCQMMNEMFGRRVLLCHNPTESMLIDLLNCVNGKVGFWESVWKPEARVLLKQTLKAKLVEAKEKKLKRVVLICHSQGTIITSNALSELRKEEENNVSFLKSMEELLEVYAFANCAHDVNWSNVRYQENISNQFDLVAWLGHLFPFPTFWVDGYGDPMMKQTEDGTHKSVIQKGFWGHLLNSHYLIEMKRNRGAYQESRLYEFMDGKKPSNTGKKEN